MDEKSIAILGGLIGSSLTIILSKILDFLTVNQQHKLSIKKEYFLKKIDVFEKAVSFWTLSHNTLSSMAILLRTSLKDEVTFDENNGKQIFEKLEKQLETLSSDTKNRANAIDLYIDIDDDPSLSIESIGKFWSLLGEVSQITMKLNKNLDNYIKESNKELKLSFEKSDQEYKNNLKLKIEELYNISNEFRNGYILQTKKLRQHMLKYE